MSLSDYNKLFQISFYPPPPARHHHHHHHHHQSTALQSATSFLHSLLCCAITSDLSWLWWVCLADNAGNVLIEHQLWTTGFAFAIPRAEKSVLVYQFILWFLEGVP